LQVPTRLFTHKRSIAAENEAKLAALPGPLQDFQARDAAEGGGADRVLLRQLQHGCPARERIALKVGAQVSPSARHACLSFT
jgi:hypothetical protein